MGTDSKNLHIKQLIEVPILKIIGFRSTLNSSLKEELDFSFSQQRSRLGTVVLTDIGEVCSPIPAASCSDPNWLETKVSIRLILEKTVTRSRIWFYGHRFNRFWDQLLETFIQTNHWEIGMIGTMIDFQYDYHVIDKFSILLRGNYPAFFPSKV